MPVPRPESPQHAVSRARKSRGVEEEEEEGHILCKADEVLMIGVDVGQLNVNQQQNLGKRQKITIRMETAQLNTTHKGLARVIHRYNQGSHNLSNIQFKNFSRTCQALFSQTQGTNAA